MGSMHTGSLIFKRFEFFNNFTSNAKYKLYPHNQFPED